VQAMRGQPGRGRRSNEIARWGAIPVSIAASRIAREFPLTAGSSYQFAPRKKTPAFPAPPSEIAVRRSRQRNSIPPALVAAQSISGRRRGRRGIGGRYAHRALRTLRLLVPARKRRICPQRRLGRPGAQTVTRFTRVINGSGASTFQFVERRALKRAYAEA